MGTGWFRVQVLSARAFEVAVVPSGAEASIAITQLFCILYSILFYNMYIPIWLNQLLNK